MACTVLPCSSSSSISPLRHTNCQFSNWAHLTRIYHSVLPRPRHQSAATADGRPSQRWPRSTTIEKVQRLCISCRTTQPTVAMTHCCPSIRLYAPRHWRRPGKSSEQWRHERAKGRCRRFCRSWAALDPAVYSDRHRYRFLPSVKRNKHINYAMQVERETALWFCIFFAHDAGSLSGRDRAPA